MSDTAATAPASDFDFQLYRYTPSLAAAITALIIFLTLTSLHVWRLVRARALYFIAFTIGGACAYLESDGQGITDKDFSQSRHLVTPDAFGHTMTAFPSEDLSFRLFSSLWHLHYTLLQSI